MTGPLLRLFERHFGVEPASVVELGADGSTRVYYRLIGPAMETAVGAYGPERDENRAFISVRPDVPGGRTAGAGRVRVR